MSFDAHRDENASESILRIPNAIDVDGERALWTAVLQRTVRDATWPSPVRNLHATQGSVTVANQAEARACLADVEWCEVMCERAGVDTSWFRQQFTHQAGDTRHV